MLEDDEVFIEYCRSHSQTPKALFIKEHVLRILSLAGNPRHIKLISNNFQDFISVHYDIMHPLCNMAKRNLRIKNQINQKVVYVDFKNKILLKV